MKLPSGAGLRATCVDRVAWLVLDRADSGNRIDRELAQRLCEAIGEIDMGDAADVVVLTHAAGPFCLGIENGGEWQESFDWVAALASLRCPTLAGIGGAALDEGLETALAVDLRIATTTATFATQQIVAGGFPRHGATQRLPRLVGLGRALTMLLLGTEVHAAEALVAGLATALVAADELQAELLRQANSLAAKGPIAARYAKEAVLAGTDLTMEQGVRLEHDLYVLLQATEDRGEGVRSFLEKRTPRFHGK